MTKQLEATPQNLYQITGNVADINTVLIERSELRRLQAENDGVQALIAVHQRTLERCLELKAECAELEAMLDAVGAGGVGQSIKPPENLRCKSTQKRPTMLWGYVKQDLARKPLTEARVHDLLVTVCSDGSVPSLQEVKEQAPHIFELARAIEQAHGITGSQQ